MRKTMMVAVAVAIAGMACAEKVQAGEKVEASVGADLVCLERTGSGRCQCPANHRTGMERAFTECMGFCRLYP